MSDMKTLTINGVTYSLADQTARDKIADHKCIIPIDGQTFGELVLAEELVVGNLYLVTEDDTSFGDYHKGDIFGADNNASEVFIMNVIGEKGNKYVLTDAEKKEIAGVAVDSMELGVTNLALNTSTDMKPFDCQRNNPITQIQHNIGGITDYVHTLEEIGVNVGDWLTFAADLVANGADLRLLVRALVATYDHNIYTTELQSTRLRDTAAGIKTAYDAGTSNWRYEAASTGYQFRLATDEGMTSDGNNAFQYGTRSLQYTSVAGQWIAIRIKSPGSGKYSVTFNHGVQVNGANVGSVYIIPAEDIDQALEHEYGLDLESAAQSMSDNPYQDNGETDIFKAYRQVIGDAISGATSVMTPCYYFGGYSTSKTTGQYTFMDDTEYVVVFTADENGPKNGYILIGSFESALASMDTQIDFTSDEYITSGNSGRNSVSFQIPEGYGKLALYVENANMSNEADVTTNQYKCLKIERGNIPTGWISAPEDTVDSIVAQGTSGIWTWEKWASGKAICWANPVFESITIDIQEIVSGFYTGIAPALMYPFSFAEPPAVFATVNTMAYEYVTVESKTTGATGNIYIRSMYEEQDVAVPLKIYVVGRWEE